MFGLSIKTCFHEFVVIKAAKDSMMKAAAFFLCLVVLLGAVTEFGMNIFLY